MNNKICRVVIPFLIFLFYQCLDSDYSQKTTGSAVQKAQRNSIEEQVICHCYFENGLIMPTSNSLIEICGESTKGMFTEDLEELEVVCADKYYRPFRHISISAKGLSELVSDEELKKICSKRIDEIKVEQALQLNLKGGNKKLFPKRGEVPMILLINMDFSKRKWFKQNIRVTSNVYAEMFSNLVTEKLFEDETLLNNIDQITFILTYWERNQLN